jgi:hypothetical protein
MEIDPARVATERAWVRDRVPRIVALINTTRDELGAAFDTDVDHVTAADVDAATETVFSDGDRAVNIAALVWLLREIDVVNDYPGFVVDELLGRELAAMIAGEQPLRLLAEATFHVADIRIDSNGAESAGLDDLDAALAAGFQTRLPGWPWRDDPSPFDALADDHP